MDLGRKRTFFKIFGRRAARASRVPKSARSRPTHVDFASQQRSKVLFGLQSWLVDHVFAFEQSGRVVFDVATDSRIDLKELLRSVVVASEANVLSDCGGVVESTGSKGSVQRFGTCKKYRRAFGVCERRRADALAGGNDATQLVRHGWQAFDSAQY